MGIFDIDPDPDNPAMTDPPTKEQKSKANAKFVKDFVDWMFRCVQMLVIITLVYYAGRRSELDIAIYLSFLLASALTIYIFVVPRQIVEDWLDDHAVSEHGARWGLLMWAGPTLVAAMIMVICGMFMDTMMDAFDKASQRPAVEAVQRH